MLARIQVPSEVKRGELITVRLAIQHPMETGFRYDHSWIGLPVTDADGRIRHTRGVTEIPGLYTLGLQWQHTRGSALLTMGVNLDYPDGGPDRLEVALGEGPWNSVPLRGSWFTEAFEGPMSNLQRFVAGEDVSLVSPVEDAIKTMAVVEACYQSSASGATPIPEV